MSAGAAQSTAWLPAVISAAGASPLSPFFASAAGVNDNAKIVADRVRYCVFLNIQNGTLLKGECHGRLECKPPASFGASFGNTAAHFAVVVPKRSLDAKTGSSAAPSGSVVSSSRMPLYRRL